MPGLNTSIQHSIGIPSQSDKTKEKKNHAIWKGRSNTTTHWWHDYIHRTFKENPQWSYMNFMSSFIRVLTYKVNISSSRYFQENNGKELENGWKDISYIHGLMIDSEMWESPFWGEPRDTEEHKLGKLPLLNGNWACSTVCITWQLSNVDITLLL